MDKCKTCNWWEELRTEYDDDSDRWGLCHNLWVSGNVQGIHRQHLELSQHFGCVAHSKAVKLDADGVD